MERQAGKDGIFEDTDVEQLAVPALVIVGNRVVVARELVVKRNSCWRGRRVRVTRRGS